jgi:hypothetical protein
MRREVSRMMRRHPRWPRCGMRSWSPARKLSGEAAGRMWRGPVRWPRRRKRRGEGCRMVRGVRARDRRRVRRWLPRGARSRAWRWERRRIWSGTAVTARRLRCSGFHRWLLRWFFCWLFCGFPCRLTRRILLIVIIGMVRGIVRWLSGLCLKEEFCSNKPSSTTVGLQRVARRSRCRQEEPYSATK